VIFKQPQYESQYNALPKKLIEVCEFFNKLSLQHGVNPVVTRVTDPVEGESGVHPAHRAVDFRNQFFDGKSNKMLYPDEVVSIILDSINEKFKRDDGKLVAIHHSFKGAPFHFHLQIPIGWVTHDEINRIYGHPGV
jgi:hypothetical protein